MNELNNENSRIKELDGLRGFTILGVVAYHYVNVLINANASSLHLLVKSLTNYFYTGVDMFFVLSGFLLGGILLKNKSSSNYFKTFFLRRIFRIVPIYIILLIIVFAICQFNLGKGTSWWFNSKIPFWIYFTYFQNFIMGIQNSLGNSWLSPTWSLGVEEQFYIIIAIVIYYSPKKLLIFILLTGIICAAFFRYFSPTVYAMSTFTHCRFDALFGGVILAILYQDKTKFNLIKKHILKFRICFFIMLGINLLFSIGKIHIELFLVNSWFSLFYIVMVIIVVFGENNILSKLANRKFFVDLGQYSYGIYLFHQVILGFFFFAILGKLPQINSINDVLAVICCAISTFFIAKFMFHQVERKFVSLGHRYSY